MDRYGICLDWSMGYQKAFRNDQPKSTDLIFYNDEDSIKLAIAAPVAVYFGDFVIGLPTAVEITIAPLHAGSTSIGNLGQYFTFELPDWKDDEKQRKPASL